MSESCGRDSLGLLLAFPEGGEAQSATEELCGLPGASAYALLVSLTRNLDLRGLVYKVRVQPGPVAVCRGPPVGGETSRLCQNPVALAKGLGTEGVQWISGVLGMRP